MNVLMNFTRLSLKLFVFLPLLTIPTGCSSEQDNEITVWTDRAEIVSYAEVFNANSRNTKVIVIYKDRLAQSIPPERDELPPDIAIGSFLKNSNMDKYFAPADSIFNSSQINPASLYPSLLAYGSKNNIHYLLPVSFNLPMIIYPAAKKSLLDDNILFTADKIRDTAASFNARNSHDIYTNMGFGPSWNTDFIYALAKMNDSQFQEKGTSFTWNEKNLDSTVSYIREWTSGKNTSTKAEKDFEFKYLYTPDYRQISFGRSLFAYTETSSFFTIPSFYFEDIGYKWLSDGKSIIAEDSIVMAGILRGCTNIEGAQEFISWLISEETQKTLLERTQKMHLDKQTFGIASGFSSIASVNEHVFPIYYNNLLGHTPEVKSIRPPYSTFPPRWQSLRERVIIPYLRDATNTDLTEKLKSMSERISDWEKQFN